MYLDTNTTNPTLSTTKVLKNISHFESVLESNKVLRSLQTSSNELSLSDSDTVDFAESASNPQTESKINTLTATSNLNRVIFDSISISTMKSLVDINKYMCKYRDNQIHIKYTYRLPKGDICVEVKSEEQKQLLISKANIIFPGCIAKTASSPFESLIIVKNFNSLTLTEDFKEDFKRTYQKSYSVCRFHSNSNKKPLPTISIKTNKTLTHTL